jgi:hypothetical protein
MGIENPDFLGYFFSFLPTYLVVVIAGDDGNHLKPSNYFPAARES